MAEQASHCCVSVCFMLCNKRVPNIFPLQLSPKMAVYSGRNAGTSWLMGKEALSQREEHYPGGGGNAGGCLQEHFTQECGATPKIAIGVLGSKWLSMKQGLSQAQRCKLWGRQDPLCKQKSFSPGFPGLDSLTRRPRCKSSASSDFLKKRNSTFPLY
jgi:hypothetical protein